VSLPPLKMPSSGATTDENGSSQTTTRIAPRQKPPFYRLQLNCNFAAPSSPTPKAGRSDFHFDFGTFLEVQCQNWPWIR